MTSRAETLADKLNSLCVAEFAWPHLNDAATELRRLAAEVESLNLAEEGAKEAFGVVVQEKRDLEKDLARFQELLASAHDLIRRLHQSKENPHG